MASRVLCRVIGVARRHVVAGAATTGRSLSVSTASRAEHLTATTAGSNGNVGLITLNRPKGESAYAAHSTTSTPTPIARVSPCASRALPSCFFVAHVFRVVFMGSVNVDVPIAGLRMWRPNYATIVSSSCLGQLHHNWSGNGSPRPLVAALNALCSPLMVELAEQLDAYEADPEIGAIVITGSTKAFAAGADIKEMAPKTFPGTYKVQTHSGSLCVQTLDSRKPLFWLGQFLVGLDEGGVGEKAGDCCSEWLCARGRLRARHDVRHNLCRRQGGLWPTRNPSWHNPRYANPLFSLERTLFGHEQLNFHSNGNVFAYNSWLWTLSSCRRWRNATIDACNRQIQGDGTCLDRGKDGRREGRESRVSGTGVPC